MDKLQMCRICLAENVHMYVVVNKTLHDLYEKLTINPFVTEDCRPILACFICCAQLKKCYRFQKKCLEAEEMFAKMMNEEYEYKLSINQDQFELFHGFIRTPIDTISIVDVDQTESIVVKEELPADCERVDDVIKTKEGQESDDDLKPVNRYDNYLDIEYLPARHFEAETEDDAPLMKVKTEMVEGKEVAETKLIVEKRKRTSDVEKLILDPRRTKQEDTITAELKNEPSHLKVIRITQYRTSERDKFFKEPPKCNQRLKRVKKLDQPTSTKNYEKLYECDVCQRSFSRTNSLKNHIRVHTGEKPYKCDVCQRTFGAKNGLTRHFRVHTGEKPYNCHLCRRNFSDKGILSRHMRLHAGEKPYKCDVCQHTFSQMYHLKRHSIIHDGEKRYQCDLCQRFYSTKRILIRHIAIHNGEKPFKCDECQRCFSLKGGLRNHIRIHTGEKPYKCDFCWRRFRNKSFLVRHVQKHTGGKPYKCDICQQRFSHKGNLRNHIIEHDEEELVAK